MKVDEMGAGREMDALVWLALNGKSIENGTFCCRYVDGDVQPHAGYPVGHISPPRYSTDIAAAWASGDATGIIARGICLWQMHPR